LFPGELIGKLQKLAVDSNIWLSLGGFHEKLETPGNDGKMR